MVQDEKDGSAIDYVASKDAVPSRRYNQDSSEQEFEIECSQIMQNHEVSVSNYEGQNDKFS